MKKLVNNKLMRVMIALGMFAFAGCQEYEIDSQPDAAANIQIDALEWYDMAAESAASVVFNISANTPWQIINDDNVQWCTVTPTMSATSGLVSEITISAEDNLSYSPRTASFTIVAPALEDFTRTILVTQASKADFTVSEVTTTVDAAGGEVVFYITSNKAWEYVTEKDFLLDAKVEKYNPTPEGEGDGSTEGDAEGDESGADVELTRAMGPTGPDTDESESYLLTINVPLNPGVERSGTFYIRLLNGKDEEGKDKHTRTVSQSGIELRLADGENTVFADSEEEGGLKGYEPGATLTFNVRASIAFTPTIAEDCADWLELVDYEVTEKNGMPTGGWVTVQTKGDYNRMAGLRGGAVNLSADGISPVPVMVYQPSPFACSWREGAEASGNHYVENYDGTITLYPGSIEAKNGVYPMKSLDIKLDKIGEKWVLEFDSDRTDINDTRLFATISQNDTPDLSSFANGVSHLTLTPDIGTTTGIGVSNWFAHNGATWSPAVNALSLDGLASNGTYYTGPLFDANDIRKLEKIVFTKTDEGEYGGLNITVTANGKTISFTRLIDWAPDNTRQTNFSAAFKTTPLVCSFGFIGAANKDYTGEYITVTKCYIDAE